MQYGYYFDDDLSKHDGCLDNSVQKVDHVLPCDMGVTARRNAE